MAVPAYKVIEADCSILLFRALLDKHVVAFGDDGLGKYGRSEFSKAFTISDLEIFIDPQDNNTGEVSLRLQEYDAADVGHIYTDQNFLISIGALLSTSNIGQKCLSYAGFESQGSNYVSLKIDVPTLLQWS